MQDGSTSERKQCKHSKPGSPNGWQVRNEECCRGQGGTWNGGHSQCCFGKLKTECDWRGKCETHCEEHFDSWKACDNCRKNECRQDKCSNCEDKRSGCCGGNNTNVAASSSRARWRAGDGASFKTNCLKPR